MAAELLCPPDSTRCGLVMWAVFDQDGSLSQESK